MLVIFMWFATACGICYGLHHKVIVSKDLNMAEGFLIGRAFAWLVTAFLVTVICSENQITHEPIIPLYLALPVAVAWFVWSMWLFFIDKRVQRWNT